VKLVAVSVVRNAADVVELFVRHHAAFFDRMLIADHASRDGTLEMLQELRDAGAPLDLTRETRARFEQAEVATALMRRAAREYGADWVLPLDADEFLTSDADPGLRPLLARLSPERAYALPWRTWVPTPGDPPGEPHLFRRVTWRRRSEAKQYWKVVVPGRLAASPRISLGHGGHVLWERRGPLRRKLAREPAPDLYLAHFPVRSAEQLAAKVLAGWPALLAAAPENDAQGFHWRELFEALRGGRSLTPPELLAVALAYGVPRGRSADAALEQHPLPSPAAGAALRWPGRSGPAPLAALADVAEGLARELGGRQPARRRRALRTPDWLRLR
jgi:hypothetical protein